MEEEFDVAVIGAGPGGYVAAIRLSQLGMKTVCIEKAELGGTCLNMGCIPSKTLLHASELLWKVGNEGKDLGINAEVSYDFSRMQARKEQVIQELNQGITGLFKKNKVTLLKGTASFESLHELSVVQKEGKKQIRAKFFIIATGGEPMALPFLPFDEKRVLSSTGALALDTVPKRLAVIGAGVIGVELGSVYSRLGSEVHFIEFMDKICPLFDPALSSALQSALTKQGMQFSLSSLVTKAFLHEEVHLEVKDQEGSLKEVVVDAVLVAIGRKPFSAGLGLEKIGITLTSKGLIPVDGNFRTVHSHILAIGDVIDGPMLAHKASEEGVAAAEIIASLSPSLNYLAIPSVIYTYPEVASVGLAEEEATKLGLSFSIGSYPFKGNSRAKCTGEEEGFVKIIVDKKTDKILGVHIIGAHASELIAQASVAFALGVTASQMGHLCQAHPTLSEALKEAALSIHKKALNIPLFLK